MKMADKKVILVTGVANYWGAQVVKRLIDEAGQRESDSPGESGEFHIIGLDSEPPTQEIKGLDFIQADIRNPLLIDLFKSERVHTVCHLSLIESGHAGESSFDFNVMGTMKLLGACAEAGVRKVVLKSSTTVYGASPSNPSFLAEQHPFHGNRSRGFTRHMVEIEAFCHGFRRQQPEMILTILRFPSIVGPQADTPMTRYLKEPWPPVLMGFDPLMQVIHERDVVEALAYTVLNDQPGVFNVAAEGVLPITKLMSLAGKIPVPVFHLFAYWGKELLDSSGVNGNRYVPIDLDYIRYSWVADLARMHNELGFTPRYTSEEALREFAGQQRLRRYVPEVDTLADDEKRLHDIIERRRRDKERQMANPAGRAEEVEDEQR
jgi:UDP-glucose 4-epimerase